MIWEEDQAERYFVWVNLSIGDMLIASQKDIQQVSLIKRVGTFINVGFMEVVIQITLDLRNDQAEVVLKRLDMMMKVG